MGMKFYQKLNTQIGKATHLNVKVDYEKGGINYFSGQQNARGMYVYIQPVEKKNGMESFMLLGEMHETGFKIFVRPMGRKNQKTIDDFSNKVAEKISDITALYEEKKYNEIMTLVKTL